MTSILGEIHYYNDWVASIFSIISNLLLLHLILKYTTTELKAYSKILLQTCCIDLFFTIIVFATKPIIEFNQGVFFLMVSGFVSNVPHPYNFYLNMLWVIGFFFCITALPIQFYYRYMLVCRKRQLSNLVFVKLFLISFFLAFTYTVVAGIAFLPTKDSIENNAHLLNNSYWVDENGKIPIFVASDISNPVLILMICYCYFLGGVCYILIIGFNILTWKKIASTKHIMSQKTRDMQKQLNYALIIQSITPMITAILPTSFTVSCVILRVHSFGVGPLIMSAVGWITAINPISAILFVAPYRMAVFRGLCLHRNNIIGASGIHPRNSNQSNRQTPQDTILTHHIEDTIRNQQDDQVFTIYA